MTTLPHRLLLITLPPLPPQFALPARLHTLPRRPRLPPLPRLYQRMANVVVKMARPALAIRTASVSSLSAAANSWDVAPLTPGPAVLAATRRAESAGSRCQFPAYQLGIMCSWVKNDIPTFDSLDIWLFGMMDCCIAPDLISHVIMLIDKILRDKTHALIGWSSFYCLPLSHLIRDRSFSLKFELSL